MAIAFDAFSRYSTGNTTSTADFSWSHTPVGTPKGVIVFIIEDNPTPNAFDGVTGVTYGGVAMSAVSGSPNTKSSGNQARVYCYFLGSGIPTGAQTVAIDKTANLNPTTACCYTVTAASPLTQVVDTDATINTATGTNPSATLSLGSVSSFCAEVIWSGIPVVGSITPPTGWTSRYEVDLGAATCGSYSYDTIGTADVTMGWTQASDDALAIGIAISECIYVEMGLGTISVAGNGITTALSSAMQAGAIALAGLGITTQLTSPMATGEIILAGGGINTSLNAELGVGSIGLSGHSITTVLSSLMGSGTIVIDGKAITVTAPEPPLVPSAWSRRRTMMAGNRR